MTLDEQGDYFFSKQPLEEMSNAERQRFQSHLQLQLGQISSKAGEGMVHLSNDPNIQRFHENQQVKMPRPFVDGDFEFVSFHTYNQNIQN